MRRKRPGWVRVVPLAGLLLANGCFSRLENGLDLVLGIRSQDAAQIAPYLSIAVPAIFFGRFLNLTD